MAGVILTVLFFFWNTYLSRAHARGSSTAWWQPPPLIPSDLWLRANGRFLAILMIVLWTWCSFLSNNFWVRVVPAAILHSATEYVGSNYGLVGSGKSTHGLGVLKLCDVVVLTSLARHSCSIRTIFAFLRSSRWSGYCLAS